jgi:hypothetical protein
MPVAVPASRERLLGEGEGLQPLIASVVDEIGVITVAWRRRSGHS